MPNLKDMYRTILKDTFPDTMTITLGDAVLTYRKRTWDIDGETKGLRYGENPDQPAALYQLTSGRLTVDGMEWRAPGGIMSALSEAQMLQAGKHPGKTNLTDVDNGCNILQYLAERPAAVILKHNNPCGAAWSSTSRGPRDSSACSGRRARRRSEASTPACRTSSGVETTSRNLLNIICPAPHSDEAAFNPCPG